MEFFDPFLLLAQVTPTAVQGGEAKGSFLTWIDFRTELAGALAGAFIVFVCASQWPMLKAWLFKIGTYFKEQFIDVPAPPLPDKINFVGLTTSGEELLEKYGAAWQQIYDNPNAADAESANHAIPLKHLRSIQALQLNTYLWPELAWRKAIPASKSAANAPIDEDQNDNLDDSWTTIQGDSEAAVGTLLQQLRGDRLMVLYDRAGMGKTAFTHKLCQHLLSAHQADPPLAAKRLLVVRLEGIWPRDAQGTPLGLLDLLADEILGLRIGGEKTPIPIEGGDDETRLAEKRQALTQSLPQWLSQGRVFVILDAFDQMQEDDRKAAVDQIALARGIRGFDQCRWLVTGRHYALRPYVGNRSLVNDDVYRVRLRPFTPTKQDAYFADLENLLTQRSGLAFAEKSRLLDQICPDRQAMASDLGIPWHLSMIRRLVEANLSDNGVAARSPLPRIETTAQLHLMVSDETLERVIERAAEIDLGVGGLDAKVRMLRRVCGVLAWQMMLDENYNAMIHAGTNLTAYRGVHSDELVATYLERCHARYLANRGQVIQGSGRSAEKDWTAAVELLRRIEVTDFSDLDVFSLECRAFRSRKTMEWYAAHFLMNHATEYDVTQACSGAGAKTAKEFVGNGAWYDCWKLALDLPDVAVTHSFVAKALGILFGQPGLGHCRPAEWMYRAWERWLQPKTGQGLADAKQIIANYRQQLDQIALGDFEKARIVARLRFNAKRDRLDKSLTEPNKTPDGWYRRIPPEGKPTAFKREHQRVTVDMFWMRKFPVTNEEYRLFDPNHRHSFGSKFDGPDQPVIEVDWYMAVMFARWLGPGYRLPTEAEWETACRAGTQTEYWFGNEEDDLPKHAWFDKNSGDRTHGLKESQDAGGHENPWGLFDMHGNVWEWCQDCYADHWSQDEVTTLIDPNELCRARRGGSWDREAKLCHSVFINWRDPTSRGSNLGFRLLLSPSEGPPEARY